MEYQYDVDAWSADSLDDCECPACGAPVQIGYHICVCGQPVNVCRMSEDGDVFFLVTMETDDLGFMNQKENTSYDIPDDIAVPLI